MAHTGKYIEGEIKKSLIKDVQAWNNRCGNSYTDSLASFIIDRITNDYGTVDIGVDYWKTEALKARRELEQFKSAQASTLTVTSGGTNTIANWPPISYKAHTAPKPNVVIPNEPKSPTEAEKPKRKSFFNFK